MCHLLIMMPILPNLANPKLVVPRMNPFPRLYRLKTTETRSNVLISANMRILRTLTVHAMKFLMCTSFLTRRSRKVLRRVEISQTLQSAQTILCFVRTLLTCYLAMHWNYNATRSAGRSFSRLVNCFMILMEGVLRIRLKFSSMIRLQNWASGTLVLGLI